MMGAYRGVIRAEAGGIKLEGGVFWYNKRSKIQLNNSNLIDTIV